MKIPAVPPARPKRGRYWAAMVLGTALSTMGSSVAGPAPAEARAVNDISRYCTACWRNARLDPACWPDCTQEVFCRLLERVAPEAWEQMLKVEGEERREFLRAIDAVKKRTQRSRRWSNTHIDTVADRHELHERGLADHRDAVHQVAAQLLSQRQQHILQLSFEGWSVQDIADELHVSPERVSDEKYKAVRKLREHFHRAEMEKDSEAEARS
jgi:RNA polymerase sigma factor (sigma-70 family)